MFRVLLFTILLILLIRAMSRLWKGIVSGATGEPYGQHSGSVPQRGVQMARDPICGTFVVPGRALALPSGRETLYFCSEACRDRYLAGDSSRTGASRERTA